MQSNMFRAIGASIEMSVSKNLDNLLSTRFAGSEIWKIVDAARIVDQDPLSSDGYRVLYLERAQALVFKYRAKYVSEQDDLMERDTPDDAESKAKLLQRRSKVSMYIFDLFDMERDLDELRESIERRMSNE